MSETAMRTRALLLLAAAIALPAPAQAVTRTWRNTTGNNAWSTNNNWDPAGEPTSSDPVILPTPVPGSSSILMSIFEGSSSLTINDSYTLSGTGGTSLNVATGSINVASGRTATIATTLNGSNGLRKTGTGTLRFTSSTHNNGFTGPVEISGTLAVLKDEHLGHTANTVLISPASTSGTLQITGTFSTARSISPGGVGGTITVNSGQMLTLNGLNGQLGGGATTLIADGAGTLKIESASFRSGQTTVRNGILWMANPFALGSGAINVSNNGRLQLGQGFTGNNVLLNSLGMLVAADGGAVLTNPVSVSAVGSTVYLHGGNSNSQLTIANYANGNGSTTRVVGSGLVALSGANNYSGAWSADSATLHLAHADAISSSASPFVIENAGTVIAQTTSNYPGGWTVGGLLRVQNATAAGIGASALDVNVGGALQIEGVNVARDVALNGGGTIRGIGSAAASGIITAASLVPILSLETGAAASDTLTVSDYTGGSGSMTRVVGAGEVILPTASTYAGTWQVSGGSLRVDHPDALGTNLAPVTVNAGGQFHISCGDYPHPITLNTGARLAGSGTAVTAAAREGVSVAPGAAVTFRTLGNPTGLVIGDGLNELTGGGGISTITLMPSAHVSILSFFNTYTGTWILRDGSSLFIVHDESLGNPANNLSLENASLLTSGTFSTSRLLTFSGFLNSGIHASSGTLTIHSGLQGGTGTLFLDGGSIVLNGLSTLSGSSAVISTDLKLNHNQALASIPLHIHNLGSVELGTNITLSQPAFLLGGAVLRGNNNSRYNGTISVDSLGPGVNLGTVAVGDVFTIGNSITGGSASSVITASGPGTIVLTQNSSFAGDWLVGGGVLQVSNASGGATGNGTVTVASGATLTGTGSIVPSEDLLNDGTVAPGTGAGRLRTHRYTPGPGGVLKIEIGGPTAGTQHDRLEVTGLATLDGTLDLALINSFEPQIGQTFVILTHGARSGEFAQVTGMSAGPGKVFRVQYTPTEVRLVVGAPAEGDVNGDGDVDLDDLALLASCATRAQVPHDGTPICQSADSDNDGDVDLDDFAVYQRCFSGTGVPADPACAQ